MRKGHAMELSLTPDEAAFLRRLFDDEQERIRQIFEHQINIYAFPAELRDFKMIESILDKLNTPRGID